MSCYLQLTLHTQDMQDEALLSPHWHELVCMGAELVQLSVGQRCLTGL